MAEAVGEVAEAEVEVVAADAEVDAEAAARRERSRATSARAALPVVMSPPSAGLVSSACRTAWIVVETR